MNKIFNKISQVPYRFMAALTSVAMLSSASAHAASEAGTFGGVADNVSDSFSNIGKMVLGGSMVAGLGLSGAGLLKLKAAADSGGQQVKYSEGLWRLGVGAGLVALPNIITTTLNTGGISGGGTISQGTASFGGGGGAAP